MGYRETFVAGLLAASLLGACSGETKGENPADAPHSQGSPEVTAENCTAQARVAKIGESVIFFLAENPSIAQDIYVATNLGANPLIQITPGNEQAVESLNTVEVKHGIGKAANNNAQADFSETEFLHDYQGRTIEESDGGYAAITLSEINENTVQISAKLCSPNLQA